MSWGFHFSILAHLSKYVRWQSCLLEEFDGYLPSHHAKLVRVRSGKQLPKQTSFFGAQMKIWVLLYKGVSVSVDRHASNSGFSRCCCSVSAISLMVGYVAAFDRRQTKILV